MTAKARAKIVTHLWYAKEAEEAARSYASIYPDSRVDAETWFEVEEVIDTGEHAVILWRFHWGEGEACSVRGVNLMRVAGGKIIEARGYVKGAP